MVLHSVFIINRKGAVVLQQSYRSLPNSTNVANFFNDEVIKKRGRPDMLPCMRREQLVVLWRLMGAELYLVGAAMGDPNLLLLQDMLCKLAECIAAAAGVHSGVLKQSHLERNLPAVLRALQLAIDYGHPNLLEPQLLSKFISAFNVKHDQGGTGSPDVTLQVTGVRSWRPEPIHKYRNQELWLDVKESLSVILSPSGEQLSGSVEGVVLVDCKLNGVPECKMGLNDDLQPNTPPSVQAAMRNAVPLLEGVSFHKCVQLNQYNERREILFVPPDGKFQLMSYRISSNLDLPFKVTVALTHVSRTKLDMVAHVRTCFGGNNVCPKLKVFIPLPKTACKVTRQTSHGKAKEDKGSSCLYWKIKDLAGNAELQLTASVTMVATTDDKVWEKPPVRLEFTLPGWTSSRFKVTFLKVWTGPSGSKPRKWVRYLTESGSYEARLP